MSVYSLLPESRFKCYCCRWNFEKNNRIISRIFASMCRPWSWMWGSCSCHDKNRCRVCFQFCSERRNICSAIATFVISGFPSSSLLIVGGCEVKSTEGATYNDLTATVTYASAKIPLILIILEILHEINQTKLEN